MRTECPHEMSELERELELYLGGEFESGSNTIRVRNPEGAEVAMTIEVDGAKRTARVTSTGFSYPCNNATLTKAEETTDLTDVHRSGLVLTGTTEQATGIPLLSKIKLRLQLEVRSAEKKLVLKVLDVLTPGVKDRVLKTIEEKERQECTKLKERTYVLLEPDGMEKVTRLISVLPSEGELELTDDLEESPIENERVAELEAELESRFGEEVESEQNEAPMRLIGVEDLLVGDIILSTTRQFLSKAIRALSGSRVSHSVLYIGDGEVIEAVGAGVLRRPLEEATEDDKYAFAARYPGLAPAQREAIRGFAIQKWQEKTRFDHWGLIRAGLGRPKRGSADRLYCTELVLSAYASAGITLFESVQRRPGDLDELSGTLLNYVGHLKVTKRQARKLAKTEEDELDFEDAAFEQELELDEELGEEQEQEHEALNALEDPAVEDRFVDELRDLADREFESESELDVELDQGLDTLAEEHFVKRLRRKRRRGKGKGVFGKILKAGAKIAGKLASATPVGSLVKAGTSLITGDAKGALKNLAKAAVGTALGPVAGTVATTALDALGGEEGEIRQRRGRAIRRVARIARDTFRELADTLPEDYDHPLVAHEVVHRATRRAMLRNGVRVPARRPVPARGAWAGRRPRPGPRRVIRVKPDEEVLLVGGE